MQRVMKAHQEKALAYLETRLSKGFRGGTLWMEMRLGKSWVALLFALLKFINPKILIICPSKPIASWMDECRLNNIQPLVLVGDRKKKLKLIEKIKDSSVVIATYESARLYDLLNPKYGWTTRILDETYKLAKPGSQKSRSMWEYHGSEFVIGLSGNPGAETPLDLVPQYIAVDGNIGPYTTPFDFYLDNTEVNSYGQYQLKKGQDQLIRDWMREHSFCMTRKEAGVGGGKEYGRIFCEIDPSLRKMYNDIVNDTTFSLQWDVNGKKETLDPLRRANWLWMLTSGIRPGTKATVSCNHKQKAVVDWMLSRNVRKVVILAQFVDECKKMHEELEKAGIRSAWMSGTTSMSKQLDVQAKFNSNEIETVVLEEVAFAMGLNFAASDTIIYVSNSMSGDMRTQSEDRIIHLDKTYDVWIYDVCCRGGADVYISDMVRDKRDAGNELVAQGARYLKEIEEWNEKDS